MRRSSEPTYDIWSACISGSVDNVQVCLDRDASINHVFGFDGDRVTPLHWAAIYGKSEVVRFLVERGADINGLTHHGMTPLVCVCRYGHSKEVIPTLIDLGADILRPHENMTPLAWAIHGNIDMARCLLDHGAPVDNGGPGMASPLFMSLRGCQLGPQLQSRMQSTVRLLLAHGAAFDLRQRVPNWEYFGFETRWETPLSYVRNMNKYIHDYWHYREHAARLNAIFDDFLPHYWTLRVQLRVFCRRANHPARGPQRLVLGDAYLPTKIGAFVVGDGILVKKKK